MSRAYVEIRRAREAGEDVSDWFYTQDEYAEAHDFVGLTNFRLLSEGTTVDLSAWAWVWPGHEKEYQFFIKNGDGEWEMIRDYSKNCDFTYDVGEPGAYEFRVNARVVGNGNEYDRYRVNTVHV